MVPTTSKLSAILAKNWTDGTEFNGWNLTNASKILQAIESPIDKYTFLRELQREHSDLFFRLLMQSGSTEQILPYIYTPTVGEACQRYHELGFQTRGLYFTLGETREQILTKLLEWPQQDINVLVVTDGERILGLGDLGAGGMGISEGKILLYTAAAGVNPYNCLPVCLDVGTNREELISMPEYTGLKAPRVNGDQYYNFVDEFIQAVKTWRPHVLLQFEDFGNHHAFVLLEKYTKQLCCFNDDIQGTACIALAGILSALRATEGGLADQRIVFLGAGEAGTGIGELIAMELAQNHGMTVEEGRKHCYFLDSKGLVCASRTGLEKQPHKVPFAHDVPYQPNLLEAVKAIKPTILIGVSTQPNTFTQEIVELMCSYCDRPIIFPLSNPTSKSECTFEEAYKWTNGKVLFASGSPFDPIHLPSGKTIYPAQANNAYIFPGVGHAAVLCNCSMITQEVFLVAAASLAEHTSLQELESGRVFPPFNNIMDVSVELIADVAEFMCKEGLGQRPEGVNSISDWKPYAREHMWTPDGKYAQSLLGAMASKI